MQRVVVDHRSALSPAEAFTALGRHDELGPVVGGSSRLLTPGDPARGGAGAVRRMRMGPFPAFEETVTTAVPGELVEYRITRGSPLRDHRGRIEISPAGSGSAVRWTVEFDSAPGVVAAVVAAILRRTVPRGMAHLLGPQVTA